MTDGTERDDHAFAGWNLVLSFPDQSPAFTYGFSAGIIWEKMRRGDVAELEETTRIENREVFDRMAAAEGWAVERKPSGVEGWDFTVMTKIKAASPNPHGLRVVK